MNVTTTSLSDRIAALSDEICNTREAYYQAATLADADQLQRVLATMIQEREALYARRRALAERGGAA